MSEITQWLLGKGAKINLPGTLDLFLRLQNSSAPLDGLFVPPVGVPVFVLNQSGGFGNAWYDRNPASVSAYAYNLVPPHASVDRINYTCPGGRKAIIEMMQLRVARITIAGPAVDCSAYATFTPFGQAETYLMRSQILAANTIGDKEDHAIGTTLTLFPGDSFRIFDYDVSTGGTCDILEIVKMTEFDA